MTQRARSAAGGLVSAASAHPYWLVIVLAASARLVVAVAVGSPPGWAVPDERQYIELAQSVASGRGAEAWYPGYGQFLYDTTWYFSAPLSLLVGIFGPHQWVGQALSAFFGVVTALLVMRLAREILPVSWATLAGLIAALLPSQVFWSSVVLRESMVWAALTAVALAISLAARAARLRQLVLPALAVLVALWALGNLREQTLLAAAWAMALSVFLFKSHHVWAVRLGALCLAALVPLGTGWGLGGYGLVEQAAPRLGSVRHTLAEGAESSFINSPRGYVGPSAAPKAAPSGGALQRDLPRAEEGVRQLRGPDGRQYAVDDSAQAQLRALPGGLLAVSLRPLPGEGARRPSIVLAQMESVLWLALYGLALLGLWAARRCRATVAFPALFAGAVLGMSALYQGNLGTAFRHRGQILWALALLAAIGVHHLVRARRSRGASALGPQGPGDEGVELREVCAPGEHVSNASRLGQF